MSLSRYVLFETGLSPYEVFWKFNPTIEAFLMKEWTSVLTLLMAAIAPMLMPDRPSSESSWDDFASDGI